MQFDLTTEDLYRICNALNTHAHDLDKDARADRRRGYTFQQTAVVTEEAQALRALSRKLVERKQYLDSLRIDLKPLPPGL